MTQNYSKELRKRMTPWEVRLWGRLRGDKFGVRFRRQLNIGKFYADFACRPLKLIIEVDGEHHFYYGNDKARDSWLKENGWQVMRFTNRQVQYELNDVCNYIELMVQAGINNSSPIEIGEVARCSVAEA